MQPVTMVSAGCRAPRRVLFDARRFDALAFSEGFSFSRKRARMYHISTAHTDVTRATVVAHRSLVRGSHVRPSRTAVKASQSSFHPCSLHGRTSREYAAIRKEIKSEERPTNGLDTPGIYITLMCLCIRTYKIKGKKRPFAMDSSNAIRENDASPTFDVFRVARPSSVCHSSRRINCFLTLSRFHTW